jgi:ABC-type glutathione transport system ATPase component
MRDVLMQAQRLVLHYKGLVRPALNDVSLELEKGCTVGIVGESGSGKSSLARCLIGMEKISSGGIMYRGDDISTLNREGLAQFRRKVQMVFQDPFNSLNPRMTIGSAIAEVLHVHKIADVGVPALLQRVGLPNVITERYPHELSGGQRQRAGIARALAVGPEILIADEPVSALDVSVQAHILNLLKQLTLETGVTLVLIAHDLAVVRNTCDRVVVMNEGVIVEEGPVDQVIESPNHPYTRNLLAAVPVI